MQLPSAIRPLDFPGGLADPAGRCAAIRDRMGCLLAVDLANGTALWRSAEPLRPLLVLPDEVLALSIAAPVRCIALPLFGAQAGRQEWASQALPLPDWVASGSAQAPDLSTDAAWLGDAIALHWDAQLRYRGGAPPGPRALAQAKGNAEGDLHIDRASGAVRPATGPKLERPPPMQAQAPADPQALAQREIGPRRYQLIARDGAGGTVRTVLRASAAAGDATLWELTVDEAPRRPPPALRP